MIRNNILQSLTANEIMTIFNKKKNFDIETYYVGEVNEKVYCYNPRTNLIMDYFFDDRLDIEWFDLSIYYNPEIKTVYKYLMNRQGKVVRQNKNGTLIDKKISDDGEKWRYPYYIASKSSHGPTTPVIVHRALATIFIPTKEDDLSKLVVDHINRDIRDYSLSNLRWATPSENRKNSPKVDFINKYRYEAYLDKERTKLDRYYTEEDIFNSKMSKKYIVNRSFFNKMCYGRYWRIIPIDVVNYLNGEELDDSLWKLHFSGKLWVHPTGVIGSNASKYRLNSDKSFNIRPSQLTIGSFRGGGYRRHDNLQISRIVAETFLNDNKPLDSTLEVDHIDTNRANNRVTNLRICTHLENMNNEKTKSTRKRPVIVDGVFYSSRAECGKALGISRDTIYKRVKSSKYPNYVQATN